MCPVPHRVVASVSAVPASWDGPVEESVLTGESLATYRRVVGSLGADAMAPVENGVCTGCYVALRPQQRVQLNGGTIVFCSSCGRLLYLAQ